ncbi:hypothetical protein Syun_003476 [Stephania yunnanensis]|uniref:U1-type domain-containing protein n=1 Tax=Stephania yunnanensis TaxID=152371 RepID=A0AAP0L3B1_9MAGN
MIDLERDVSDDSAADRAEETDERGGGTSEEEGHALRDRLLQEQGSLLAFRSVAYIRSLKTCSWSKWEKDLDEVLQSQIVYSNVSKGVLAKSKDLIAAFGSDDQSKICLEIMAKGELQVAGKERESQLSSQFRDIATIVMQKTINPETQHPYTISMIERLMHEIHFAVDPNSSSKKQTVSALVFVAAKQLFNGFAACDALEVIRELQKHFPIKRSPMRLRITLPGNQFSSLTEKLNSWNANIVSKDETGNQLSAVCEIDPGFFRDCDTLVRNLLGKLEILAVSVHFEGDTHVDFYDDHDDVPSSQSSDINDAAVFQLSEKVQKRTISTENSSNASSVGETKQNKCSTCNAVIGDAKQYRDHFKTEWHKHNLKRKTRQLPPLTAEECSADMEIGDSRADLKEYSF